MVTTYDLRADDFWDVYEALILKHSLNIFIVLWKTCRSRCFCFVVIVLKFEQRQSHASNIDNIKTVLRYLALEEVSELVKLRKASCSVYKDLMEKKELAQVKLARQKAKYFG